MNLQINRRLLVIKSHYFVFFAAIGCLMPFLPVYVQNLGLTTKDLSIIYLIMPLSTIIAKPLCGNLADWLRRHKSVLIANLIIMSISYFGIAFVPKLVKITKQQQNATVECDRSNLTLSLCLSEAKCKTEQNSCNFISSNTTSISTYQILSNGCTYFNLTNDLLCNTTIQCHSLCEERSGNEYYFLYACMIGTAMSCGVSISLADTIAFHLSTKENVNYGISRLWGSVGWGIFTIISGYIFTRTDLGQYESSVNPVFYVFLALCAIDVCIATFLRIDELPKPKRMLKNLTGVLRKPFFILFTIAVFVMGMLTGALWTYEMVYVEELGGGPLLFGLIMGVQCFLGEIPMFIFADRLLQRIGYIHAMPFCIVSFAFRYVCYSFLSDPWYILPLELINGVTFGLFFAGVVSFASVNAPPGMTATMQGIEQGVFEGFGLGFGSLVTGQMYSRIGGRSTFLYLGIAAVCFAVLYEVCVFALNKFDPNLRSQIELAEKVATEET